LAFAFASSLFLAANWILAKGVTTGGDLGFFGEGVIVSSAWQWVEARVSDIMFWGHGC